MANLPTKIINEVKKRVERYALDKGDKEVSATTIYSAKCDVKLMFPIAFNTNYEKHMGPVTGASCSPFHRRLFLTASTDGTVRMYDTLGHRPVAVFEPGSNEYLLAVKWSPVRPCVFVTVSDHGTVYIFDLLISKQIPAYVIKQTHIDNKNKQAYSIGFNPRQRDFLSIGYHDGSVKIIRLSYSLANKKRDEMNILKSYLEEKGSEF
jgi:WD40 repeat protein